jgi:hypothetical protein
MAQAELRLVTGSILPTKKEHRNGEELSTLSYLFSFLILICDRREGKHVRVTGSLKSFGKKRYINVNHIRNVKDLHEVYFHILEAIAVNLTIERGPVSLRLPYVT